MAGRTEGHQIEFANWPNQVAKLCYLAIPEKGPAAAGSAVAVGIILSLSITRPINHIIAGLNEGAEQVSSAAEQVSSASQSLAQGASEQAASIEETSASVEETASMTRTNAGNANEANTLMTESGRVVHEANESMTELICSTKEISAVSKNPLSPQGGRGEKLGISMR